MTIKAFLFDLDGVIIDSEREYTKIWSRIDEKFPTGIPDFATRIKGMTLSEILNQFYSDEVTRTAVKKYLHELESLMQYDWCEGAKEFLVSLQNNGIPCALVTSSDRVKMKGLATQIPGLEDYFDVVITGELVSCSKPNPEGYLKAASLLKVDPTECVVLEDSLQGVKAGAAAGAFVVGVEGTLPADVISPFCNRIVNTLREIDPMNLH